MITRLRREGGNTSIKYSLLFINVFRSRKQKKRIEVRELAMILTLNKCKKKHNRTYQRTIIFIISINSLAYGARTVILLPSGAVQEI